jgi:hypothetical protein
MSRDIVFMGLISMILNMFGCIGQTSREDRLLSKEDKEQLSNAVKAFKNRPIYKILTEQIIDTTSNDNLLQVVFDNLSAKQPSNYEKEYETVMSWNKARQAIYMIWVLEGEVNNGGYNQYYFNSNGKFSNQLPEALELVGANKFADLTKRANKSFEKENEKITKDQDGTLEGFSKSYDDNPLNNFDTEFYDLYKIENLQQLQIDFIRKNKKEFIDK